MSPNTPQEPSYPSSTCAPLSPDPSPLPACLHRRSPAGSEPAPRWIKNSPRKRTRMTRIGRIFTDFPIRANPCHPRNPCSMSASLFVDAPEIHNVNYLQFAQTTNLRSSAFICGSFFARAPDINCSKFIKSQNSRSQSHHIFIQNTFSVPGTMLYTAHNESVTGRFIQKYERSE